MSGSRLASQQYVTRFFAIGCLLLAVVAFEMESFRSESGQKPLKSQTGTPKPKKEKKIELKGKQARQAFIRRARAWAPTTVPAMDLPTRPQAPGPHQPTDPAHATY